MKKYTLSLIAILGILSCACTTNTDVKSETEETHMAELDDYINRLMTVHEIPGTAVAVIQNGDVIHEGYYGLASLEHAVPVAPKHLFRVYSTTKILVATAIFQLKEKGLLHEDDLASKHLNNLPEAWNKIQIKHLLSHTSGLPDFIRFDSQMKNDDMWQLLTNTPVEFEAGTQWRYNQTNYWLLAKIIEKLGDQPLERFLMDKQFEGKAEGAMLSSDSREVIPKRIFKYNYDHQAQNYTRSIDKEQSRGLAGNGLNITDRKSVV